MIIRFISFLSVQQINPFLYSIMSTKFRQSVIRLGGRCIASSRDPHRSDVLFCQEYEMRPMFITMNRDDAGGTTSTTVRLPNYASNISRSQERKLLLPDNTPTPITASAASDKKFTFP